MVEDCIFCKIVDEIAGVMVVLSSLGLTFSFFSKPNMISTQNIQLAPPFPNYMIYVFLAMLLGGAGYFLIKKFKK